MEGGVVKVQAKTAAFDNLAGVRVVDLSQYEAGPSCTEALAWLGAEVVKVEKPGTGEPARYGYARRPDNDSWYFCQFNANKKSVTIDLKSPRGIELIKDLIREADVFIENLAPGAIERLGLGYEVAKKVNPKIVYAQIKGFGEGSPHEFLLAYDPVAQATGGIMSVTGERGGPPVKPGPGLGDTGTGMLMAVSTLGALSRAHATGQGQRLQVAMQDACMSYIRLAWAHTLHTGEACGRHGAKTVVGNVVPQGAFRCKGGGPNDYIIMYCHPGVPEQFQRLLEVIGRKDLLGDPKYYTQAARLPLEAEINEMIENWTLQHTKHEAMDILGAAKVPVGAVRDTRDLYDDPDFEQRGLMQPIQHPTLGEFRMVGWPVRHDGAMAEIRPAPLPGEHTDAIFGEWLKMERDEIEKLRQDGVV
jgi:crotonobetainyl-CoA:carnitine CoA-transferase CaiB-like acyl-CoA transferase